MSDQVESITRNSPPICYYFLALRGGPAPDYRYNVFISGTSNDLAGYRRVTQDALLDGRLYPLVEDHFASDARSLEETIEDMIAHSDMVICLVGFEFGDAPASHPNRSWTQHEYDFATKLGKPVYVFFSSTDLRPADSVRDAKRDDLQLEFRQSLKNTRNIRFFASPDELRLEIAKLVVTLSSERAPVPTEGLTAPELSVLAGGAGGLLSGIIIGALYYRYAGRNWVIALEIASYTTLIGGWAAYAIPLITRRVQARAREWGVRAGFLRNEVAAAGLAGICAAPVIGIFGGIVFAFNFNKFVVDIPSLFPATALGAIFISAGILLSESASNFSGRVRALLSSALAGAFVLLASTTLQILKRPLETLFVGTLATYVLGCIPLFSLVGLEIGLQLGLSHLFHKKLGAR
jgi:hypothetical protein